MTAQTYFDDSTTLKKPPYSLEAEQSLIGGLLIPGSDFDLAADLISENDFYHPAHRVIFAAMSRLARAAQPIDFTTVGDAITAGDMERVGGFGYLVELARSTPSTANLKAYASVVKERANLRMLIRIGGAIAESAYDAVGRTSSELIDEAQRWVMEIGERGDASADLHVAAAFGEYIDELDRRRRCDGLVGLATGFTAIDARTNGLVGGDLIIIGGRPKSGKTTFAMNIAQHVAVVRLQPVLVFSMEMSRVQLVDRMVSSIGGIPFTLLRSGQVFGSEYSGAVIPAANRIKGAPLFIDDRPALSIEQMRTAARRQHRKTPLSLIVVDYLQLARAKAESRVMEITVISQGLKALARELNVPVIALSQLSRKCEEQKRRPMASDLRDSGSIEQDADGIFLIYRDEVYSESSDYKGMAEIIIPALRNGEAGSELLNSNLAMCRFENRESSYVAPVPRQTRRGGFDYG